MRPEQYIQAARAYLVASAKSHAFARPSDEPTPFVTISREAGAGAHSLGSRLVDLMNVDKPAVPWTLFDDNLVQQVLRDHDLPTQLEKYLGEESIEEVREFIEVSLGLHPHTDALVGKVNATIIALARMGHVVIVGRGAHVLTRPLRGGLHLRLIADLVVRKQRLAKKQKIDERAALEQITALDAGRRAYVKRHFSADVTSATDYDLLINTTHQPLDDLARMLAARLRPAPAQAGIR